MSKDEEKKDELTGDPLVHEGGKDPFFAMDDEPKTDDGKDTKKAEDKPLFLISTDSFSNC